MASGNSGGGGNIFKECLSPRIADQTAATAVSSKPLPTQQKHHHHGKTNNLRVVTFDMATPYNDPSSTHPPTEEPDWCRQENNIHHSNNDDDAAIRTRTNNKHQQPTTPLKAMSNFFSLSNIEKIINCVPLHVDPRSPNSRVTGSSIVNDGQDERDDAPSVMDSSCFNFSILSPTRKDGVVDEKRQDTTTTFTKRETAEFTFMAEREAITINGDITTDNEIPSPIVPSDVHLMNNNNNNNNDSLLDTSKHSETSNTEINLKGVGDTYLLQLVQQTAWNLNVNDAVTPRAGAGSSRVQKNNERKENVAESIPTDVIVPSSMAMDSSVKADAVVGGVAKDVKNEKEVEELPEGVDGGGGEDVPGGLWSLLPNEISDENTNNKDSIMGMRSADSQEEKQLAAVQEGKGLNGDDQVLMMRTPKAVESDSGFFDRQEHTAEDPILAAQLAVTHAMSPNSQNSNGNYNDKYWLDTKDDSREESEDDEEEEPGKIVMKKAEKAPSMESDDNLNETHIQQPNYQQVDADGHLSMQEESMQVPKDNNEDEFNSHYYMPPPSSQGPRSDTNQDEDTQQNEKRRHQYANDEEANKHFDSIMSSFELSLNRNDHRSPPTRTKAHMSPLTAAAYKKKRFQQQSRPRHQNHEEDDLESKQGSTYSSSNSSTFLEETIMGRKLTHTPSTSSQIQSNDLVHRAEQMVNQANETLDSLNNQEDEDGKYSVDNIQEEFEQEKEEKQPSVGKRRQRGMKHLSRLHYSTQHSGDDVYDDEKNCNEAYPNFNLDSGDEEEVDQVSFDSSVNWDVLNYSISDNNSANFGPSDRMGSPRSNASGRRRNINDDDDANWSKPKLVNDDNGRVTKGMATPSTQYLDIHMYTPSSPQSSTIVRKKTGPIEIEPPIPKQHTPSVDLTPRAWERIEQIKRHHDEEIGKLRDDKVASPSEEENVEPTSTNQMKQRVESIKKYHDNGMTTPRTHNKMEMEVRSRIDAMKMLHQENMDRMKNALEDINNSGNCTDDGSNVAPTDSVSNGTQKSRDDDHIAQCVGLWKANQSRFEKAKQRYSSLHRKTTSTPKHQQSSFKFDDDVVNSEKDCPRVVPASPLSPRVQELMTENEKLDEEMKQIMLISPRNNNVATSSIDDALTSTSGLSPNLSEKSLSMTISTEEHVSAAQCQYTPSSARYTTPRGNAEHSSAVSNIKPETEAEAEMSDSISELIADVKKFLDDNQNDRLSLTLQV